MKKTLIAIMTIAALAASCNKAEVIEVNRQAITFGEAFVDNATKADYSSGKALTAFQVWGTVTGNSNTVNLYNGAEVTGKVGDPVWSCNQTEYWVPSCSYSFIAIADATSVTAPADNKNMPTEIGYTVAANKDLIIATATATTDESAAPTPAGPVSFTFNHLLSKVLFSFEYGVENNTKYAFNIKDVTISGLTAKGKYAINGTWAADGAETTSLSFGTGTANVASGVSATSTASHQILPLTQTLSVTVTYDIIYDGPTIMTGETQTATLSNQAFEANKVYSINVKMPAPGAKIEFSVTSVGGFSNGGTIDIE